MFLNFTQTLHDINVYINENETSIHRFLMSGVMVILISYIFDVMIKQKIQNWTNVFMEKKKNEEIRSMIATVDNNGNIVYDEVIQKPKSVKDIVNQIENNQGKRFSNHEEQMKLIENKYKRLSQSMDENIYKKQFNPE